MRKLNSKSMIRRRGDSTQTAWSNDARLAAGGRQLQLTALPVNTVPLRANTGYQPPTTEFRVFRRLALAAAIGLAPVLSAAAQSTAPSHAPLATTEPHDSAQCATLHAMMLQHLNAMGMDSTQIAALHASLKDAIARGASPDSLHHALLHRFMQTMHGNDGVMAIDSAHVAAIHSCLASHAAPPSATAEKRR